MSVKVLLPKPHPAGSYAEALDRIAALQAKDTEEINPVSRLAFMGHGRRTEQAIVFFHGYTNSPMQFRKLGEAFHALGYSVLIPRLPHHGLSDRLNVDHALLTADELTGLADEAVDIALGLGERVTVAGLSMGGVMTGWVAQERPEVERVALIAPGFSLHALPARLTRQVTHVLLRMPNIFIWWDPLLREKAPGPSYGYPRYATHALGQMLTLSAGVFVRARKARPAVRSIVVVTNANDFTVDNGSTARLVGLWRSKDARVDTYEFPADLRLPHDLIDPSQVTQRTDIVYPVLERLMRGN